MKVRNSTKLVSLAIRNHLLYNMSVSYLKVHNEPEALLVHNLISLHFNSNGEPATEIKGCKVWYIAL